MKGILRRDSGYLPRMKRTSLWLVLAFLAGAGAMALVAVVAGLWNETSHPVILDTERVERAIEASILAQRHLASSVSCPDNVVQKTGVVFSCQATVSGRVFSVVVTETDGNGHVTYVVT
jgi:Domain of unknown function (DUF4333)